MKLFPKKASDAQQHLKKVKFIFRKHYSTYSTCYSKISYFPRSHSGVTVASLFRGWWSSSVWITACAGARLRTETPWVRALPGSGPPRAPALPAVERRLVLPLVGQLPGWLRALAATSMVINQAVSWPSILSGGATGMLSDLSVVRGGLFTERFRWSSRPLLGSVGIWDCALRLLGQSPVSLQAWQQNRGRKARYTPYTRSFLQLGEEDQLRHRSTPLCPVLLWTCHKLRELSWGPKHWPGEATWASRWAISWVCLAPDV